MMTDRDLLLDRVDLLLRSLGLAKVALNRTMPEPADLVTRFKEKMAAEFARAIEKCQGILEEASTKVKSEGPLAECWSLYGKAREEAEALIGESLAFRAGALMRVETLDDGMFPIADELIRELAYSVFAWPAITILAESEYTSDRARIIGLRYPAVSIWDLPIAAHEFGHIVASEGRPLDFRELAKDSRVDAKLLEEHFADIFATYALGPAFACTMILHRFDPSNAHPVIEWTHPGDAKRVYCIIETLRKMEDSRGSFSWLPWVDENVSKPWEASLAAVDQRRDLDRKVVDELDRWLEKVLGLFEREFFFVKYGNKKYADRGEGWPVAQKWSSDWIHQLESQCDLTLPNDITSQSTIRDALNAAWRTRVDCPPPVRPDKIERIETTARHLCQAICTKRSQSASSSPPPSSTK